MAYLDLVQKFQKFDSNSDGTISADELKCVLQSLDESMWTDEAVETLLSTCDTNADRQIQYEEFIFSLMKGKDTSFEGAPLLKEFFAVEPGPHPEPSEKATKAYSSIVHILQGLDAEDLARVRASLLRDFRLQPLGKKKKAGGGSCSDLIIPEGPVHNRIKLFGPNKAFVPDLAKLPDDFDFQANSAQQIASGEIEEDEIQFEAGEDVMALGGVDVHKKRWAWMRATVRACYGKCKVKVYEHKLIFYIIEWSDGYNKDLMLAQERLRKIDDGIKFHPGQRAESESTGGWITCTILDSIRVPWDQSEPKLYHIKIANDDDTYYVPQNRIRSLTGESTEAKSVAEMVEDRASRARANFIAQTFPGGMPDYYGC